MSAATDDQFNAPHEICDFAGTPHTLSRQSK